MPHTIRRNGRMFRYAYWFRTPDLRPDRVNLCPFFWRIVGVTLMMIPYWLIWVPFAFTTGIFFAARPNIFAGEYRQGYDDWHRAWSFYRCWPRILKADDAGIPFMPIFFFVPHILWYAIKIAAWGISSIAVSLWDVVADSIVKGHSVAYWIVSGAVFIAIAIALIAGLEAITKSEWYTILQDRRQARKERICPTYTVVD